MTKHGFADNATYEVSRLTREEARQMKMQMRRTIVYNGLNSQLAVIDAANDLQQEGVDTVVVVTTESTQTAFEDYKGYCTWLNSFLTLADGAIHYVEIQNELDTPAWGITNDQIVELTKRAADVVTGHGVYACAPSLLSGPSEGRFQYIAERVHDYVHHMTVHPYYCSIGGLPSPGWFFGAVEQKAKECGVLCPWITTLFSELGYPTQYDIMTEDLQWQCTDKLRQFQHPSIHGVIQFCRDDYMVPDDELVQGKDFGLIRRDGIPKRAYTELMKTQPYKYVEGFKEWHDLEPTLIGDPLENEHGGIPGMSQQLTTNGLLTWANIVEGQARTFYHLTTKKRFVLYPNATHSVEI